VRVPSLYNHVTSLDDLHNALAHHALRQLTLDLRVASVGQVGQAALVAVAVAYRRFALAHRGTYPLTLRAPSFAPQDSAWQALADELLQMFLLLMASCGLHGDDAIHAVRGLRALLHGFASLETVEGFKLPVDLEESFQRALGAYLAGVMGEGVESEPI
jgi:AcrR family transcriptional regulator